MTKAEEIAIIATLKNLIKYNSRGNSYTIDPNWETKMVDMLSKINSDSYLQNYITYPISIPTYTPSHPYNPYYYNYTFTCGDEPTYTLNLDNCSSCRYT